MKLQIIGLGILEVDELKPCRFCGEFSGKNVYVTEDGLDMYPAHFRCIPLDTHDRVREVMYQALGRPSA